MTTRRLDEPKCINGKENKFELEEPGALDHEGGGEAGCPGETVKSKTSSSFEFYMHANIG